MADTDIGDVPFTLVQLPLRKGLICRMKLRNCVRLMRRKKIKYRNFGVSPMRADDFDTNIKIEDCWLAALAMPQPNRQGQ
jgi:hypothetical protein